MLNPIALLTASALIAALAAPALAENQIHYRIRGLAPSSPPAPACVDPATATPGDVSSRFCGYEGTEMLRVTSGGVLLERPAAGPARWDNVCAGAGRELPTSTVMHEAMRLKPEMFLRYTWYWMSSYYGITQLNPDGSISSSQNHPEAEHPTYCARRY